MEYFAGANTRAGFVSLFHEAFKDTQRLYILKGSSGCGKSTFMRRVAGKAQKLGLVTHMIFCSGDPESLDGVIIPKLGIAVADGTAPHTMDVKYPCVCESIINLGQFWKEDKLLPHRDKIIELTDRKSAHYKNAYRILAAIGQSEDMKSALKCQGLKREALDNAAFALAEKVIGLKGTVKPIFASAFTFDGIKTLPVFGDVKLLFRINGRFADEFMKALERITREKGAQAVIAYSPTDPSLPEAVYFEGTEALVTSNPTPPCRFAKEEKNIPTVRFAHSGALQGMRSKLNGLDKLNQALAEEAQKELAAARAIHSEIESIYIPAMDFHSLDEFTYDFIGKLLGE